MTVLLPSSLSHTVMLLNEFKFTWTSFSLTFPRCWEIVTKKTYFHMIHSSRRHLRFLSVFTTVVNQPLPHLKRLNEGTLHQLLMHENTISHEGVKSAFFSFWFRQKIRKIIQKAREPTTFRLNAGRIPIQSTTCDKCCAGVEMYNVTPEWSRISLKFLHNFSIYGFTVLIHSFIVSTLGKSSKAFQDPECRCSSNILSLLESEEMPLA